MYYSISEATGTGGSIQVAVPPYLSKSHITVYVDFLPTEAFEWVNAQTISVIAALNRKVRVVRRTSPGVRLSDYLDGQPLGADSLDLDSLQAFYLAQEALDRAQEALAGNQGPPSQGGVELTTQGIKDLLLGQITPSMLEITLRQAIGLVTAGPGVVGSPAWHASEEARARGAAIVAEAEARMQALILEAGNRTAAINVEAQARQNADSALAQQITLANAAIGQNVAAIQQEVSARADADAAIATSLTQLETRYKADDLALAASITALQQATSTADAAIAQDLAVVKAQIGGSDNLFPNPGFARGSGVAGLGEGDIINRGGAGVPANAPSDRVLRHTTRDYVVGPQIPCLAGEQFELDVWVGLNGPLAGNLEVGLLLYVRNSAGTIVGFPRVSMPGDFTGWRRTSGTITVGSDWVSLQCVLWANRSGSGETPIFFSLPVVRRKAPSMAAVETNASAIATKMAGVEANYTIKVQARSDGKQAIAGIGLNATASSSAPTQSEMVFMADKFTFVPSAADFNAIPQPLLVGGLVNGQNTVVIPPSRLGDRLVQARMLVDGVIEARHLTANSITADKIDSRGLSIRDGAGNVILAAGSALPTAYAAPGTLNSDFSGGQNLIPNSDQTSALTMGWSPFGGASFPDPLQYASNTWSTTYTLRAGSTRNLYARQAGPIGGGDQAVAADFYPMGSWTLADSAPVLPGQRVCFSAYLVGHRCGAGVGLQFFDHAGGFVGSADAVFTGVPAGPADALREYSRLQTIGVAPWNAAWMRPYIRKYNTLAGHGDSYIWIAAPQLEVIGSTATGPSAYRPGGARNTRELGYSGDLNATFGANGSVLGGANLTPNGGFERLVGSRPWNFSLYAAFLWGTITSEVGRAGGLCARVVCTGDVDRNSSWGFGISAGAEGASGVRGGWQPNRTYTLSFWARRVNGSGWNSGLHLNWNVWPAGGQNLKVNPILSTSWQRYEFLIVWGPSVEGGGGFFLTVSNPSATRTGDELLIDDLQWQEGDFATQYTDSVYDTVSPSRPITASTASTFIADAALGTAQVGTLTAQNLTVGAISNTVNGNTSWGGRVEITTNRVQVFDGANALRVRLGSLL